MPEPVGSWLLACDGAACVLRHKDRLFRGAGVTADMEVRAAGKALVPVVTLRGLPNQVLLASAMAGEGRGFGPVSRRRAGPVRVRHR